MTTTYWGNRYWPDTYWQKVKYFWVRPIYQLSNGLARAVAVVKRPFISWSAKNGN